MAYEYGYGVLEDQLIDLFRSGPPDFEAAKELLSQGANLNAVSEKSEGENILSEILRGYWYAGQDIDADDYDYRAAHKENPNLGNSMIQIVAFFLDHGFSVHKHNGQFGAHCLYALVLSVFSAHMLTAAKLLFDAGARNVPIDDHDPSETPWDLVGAEGSFQDTCEHNHHLGNLFEAYYQMFQAIEDGRPYSGIGSYETAIGKRILKVLAEKPESGDIFNNLALPNVKYNNCFNRNLYFLFHGGYLTADPYGSFWVNTGLPEKELVDVSDKFPGIVGSIMTNFHFGHRNLVKGTTHYEQPITTIEMDSGVKVVFSNNFGEVEQENRAAFRYSLPRR